MSDPRAPYTPVPLVGTGQTSRASRKYPEPELRDLFTPLVHAQFMHLHLWCLIDVFA